MYTSGYHKSLHSHKKTTLTKEAFASETYDLKEDCENENGTYIWLNKCSKLIFSL